MQVGRFGWKSQHSSLMSSCADSLRNELGMRNRLYPDEYPTHAATDSPTPFDTPDAKTHKTELERLVDEIRRTSPPARDANLAANPDALAGEKLFTQIGCAICHVPTYKTCRLERASTAVRTKSRSSSAMRSSIPIAISCCTMSAPETASPKPPSRNTWTNPPPTNSALLRCGASDSATT